jgi:hypothetical protein
MISSLLYSYITNPAKTLENYSEKKPYIVFFLIILLSSFVNLLYLDTSNNIIFSIILFFLLNCSLLFIQGIILDFFAQLFNLKSQSLTLFLWLGIAWMPMLLFPALSIIFSRFIHNLSFINTILILCCLALQVMTVKTIYQVSMKKSIFIFIFPWVLAFGLFIALSVLTAFSVSFT